MKAYTDISQSKKLAEILPIESADMYYTLIDQGLYLEVKQGIEPSKDDIPCWSLSALMNVLPYPSLAQHASGLWSLVAWVDKAEAYSVGDSVCGYDNEIDACVAMIEKLHELKML